MPPVATGVELFLVFTAFNLPYVQCFLIQGKADSHNMPEDVRRVASANTLRVMKGAHFPHWNQIKNAVKFMGKSRMLSSFPKKTTAGDKRPLTSTSEWKLPV